MTANGLGEPELMFPGDQDWKRFQAISGQSVTGEPGDI
jgi:hypothetical protein